MPSPALVPAQPSAPVLAARTSLRVAIVEGVRIVEERVLASQSRVTIGTASASTFIVPSELLPARWRLFERRRDDWFLILGAGMVAQVAQVAQVAIDGRARSFRGGDPPSAAQRIPLPEGARGKVRFGDTTVLFQLVRPPARAPRPRLPVSVKRRALAEVDMPFTAVLAAVLALHVAVVVYLRQVDWPRHPALEEVPDRFVHQWLRMPRPPSVPPASPVPDQSLARDQRTAPISPARPPRGAARAPTTTPPLLPGDRRAALEAEVRSMGILPLLTARGADSSSRMVDLLAPGAVDRPLDEALRGVNGIQIARDESLAHLGIARGITGKIARVEGLRPGPGISGPAEIGASAERHVPAHLEVGAPEIEAGRGDPQAIAREIRERRKAIAACYERALKQQPTLAGKLVVRFTIVPAGTVAAVAFDDDTLRSPAVAACVQASIARWRFAPTGGGPVEVSFPFVFQVGD